MIESSGKSIVTISDIKAQYKGGGLFSHKYEVIITPPENLFDTEFTRKLRILAKSATIPKKDVKTKMVSFHGRPVVFRSQVDFTNACSISVYEDSSMSIRKTLEKWVDMVDNLEGKTSPNFYQGSICVYQLDGEGNRVFGVEYEEAFLVGISEIKYQAELGDVLNYDLTFAFTTWKTIGL